MTSPILLEAALSYADIGWPVFPVAPDKTPLTRHGFEDATTHEGVINEWWGSTFPDANIGLGIPEGLIVLDFDPRNGAPPQGVLNWGDRTPLTAVTPSGGYHLYFTVDPDLRTSGKLMGGVDVKLGGRGYVLVPPSTIGENDYFWLRGEAITELKDAILPLPTWAVDTLRRREATYDFGGGGETVEPTFAWDLGTKYGLFGLCAQLGELVLATNGDRNNTLNRVGFRVGQYVAAGEVKEAALHEVARVAELIGLTRDEILVTLKSSFEAGMRKPWKR